MSRAVLRVLLVPVLVACGSDAAPVAPSVAATCDGVSVTVRTLEPLESVVVTGSDVACVALGGADREFLVVPQLTGAALPYGGYGFRLGAPAAIAAATITEPAPPLFARIGATGADDPPLDAQARLDAHLRRLEATTPPPVRVSSRAAITPRLVGATVDSLRRFSVLNTLAATAAYTAVDARLAFAGTRVLVYVDTLAASAFTPSELQGLGTLADQRLTPIVTDAFGGGSDLDGNGRVIFLLTPVVNALAPAPQCTTSGFVRGFFYSHDLASTASTSNRGEVFYGYVPDPAGRWGCAHSRADVLANLPPTFIHELQHMVSYGEHAVERGGEAEQPWLNEALSHVAEELGSLSYESRFPAPSGRTNPAQLFPDSAGPFITPNLLYSYRFLFSSATASLTSCAPGTFCSLSERGGTWLFLRWIADRQGAATLRRLVETSLTGRANLEAATGQSTAGLLARFALATNVDSLPGLPRTRVPAELRFESRNLRRLYRSLFDVVGLAGGVSRPFPIEPLPLVPETSVVGTMRPGSFLTYRLRTTSAVTLLRMVAVDRSVFPEASGAQLAIVRLP